MIDIVLNAPLPVLCRIFKTQRSMHREMKRLGEWIGADDSVFGSCALVRPKGASRTLFVRVCLNEEQLAPWEVTHELQHAMMHIARRKKGAWLREYAERLFSNRVRSIEYEDVAEVEHYLVYGLQDLLEQFYSHSKVVALRRKHG